MADKLASSIIRNALVPINAPILPYQAYVDWIQKFVGLEGTGTGELLLNNKGITNISGQLIAAWLNLYSMLNGTPIGGTTIDLRDNKINLTNLNTLLVDLAAGMADSELMASSCPIKLTGTNMGTPTLPIFHINFNNLVMDGSEQFYGACKNEVDLPQLIYAFGGGDGNLATSVFDWTRDTDVWIHLKLDDVPTKQQIINWMVANSGGKVTDLGGLIISVAPVNHALEPFDFTGMTGSSLTQGNNNVGKIAGRGFDLQVN